jgi:hypothetical protein
MSKPAAQVVRRAPIDPTRALVSVHALEAEGVNEIPAAFAKLLSVCSDRRRTSRLCSRTRWATRAPAASRGSPTKPTFSGK